MRDNLNTFFATCSALALGAVFLAGSACAEPLPRGQAAAGSVIDRKSGEEVQFVDLSNWQNVELKQDLLGGDVLRTNATGQLAILFADHTQVRLGRNSALQVKQMGTTEDTVLNLQSGSMWARAQRGGQGLTVETPAAAAAIRGTDWTLSVNGDKTSLIVLEGEIEFKNDFGSVKVKEGEAAVASIGQAPQKLVIAQPKDRQQMLFYLTLRAGFQIMPASPLPESRLPAERDRIDAIAPESRSTEDWLTLAEARKSLNAPADVREALDVLKGRRLTAAQQARVDLIEALIAGSERRYADADALFRKAGRHLDPERRAMAAYGGYFSRSLADPNHVEQPPKTAATPYSEVMRAYTQGFLQDLPAAIEVIRQAETRFPADATLPAVRAMLYGLTGNREDMEAAVMRAVELDPNNLETLQARALLSADYYNKRNDAIAYLEQATRVAPGSSGAWNSLGLAYQEKDDARRAEAAFLKAIELDPDDPVGYANLSILYLDQLRLPEAKKLIDKALEVDPAFSVGLVARGRYYLQTGEMDKAMENLLAGSTANPGYSQAQILLAAGHYMNGERDPANQAVDNADKLDKNDTVAPALRTALAIDNYDAEGAIRNAQELMRRSRAEGGDMAALSANQDAGSTLNNAFRLQGLNAWGRYYGDAVFDPFAGSSYIDQAIRGQANPYFNSYFYGGNTVENDDGSEAFSSQLQGLLLDPHMLAGRSRTATLVRSPFLDVSLGGGAAHIDGATRRVGQLEVQGYTNTPLPISMLANISWTELPTEGDYPDFGSFDAETAILDGNGYLTVSPTAYDHLVIYGTRNRTTLDINSFGAGYDFVTPVPLARVRADENYSTNAGIGWSHTFGYHNVVNAALLYSDVSADISRYFEYYVPRPLPYQFYREKAEQQTYVAAINHAIGNDDVTVRYGIEGGWVDTYQRQRLRDLIFDTDNVTENSLTNRLGRAYVDVLQEFQPNLKAEYALFGSYLGNDDAAQKRLEPRIGIAWAPADNHWLRAAYMRQGLDPTTPTLSPIGVVGIQPMKFDLAGGYADTLALQWDAEWTDRFFTSVDYQHQELKDFSIGFPLTALPIQDVTNIKEGTIDRASFTTNTVIGGGFGLSTTLALARSHNEDITSLNFGGSLPYLPEVAGQVALTWVNENNVKATLAANYVGRRDGDDTGKVLDDYWTLDADLTWEPFDKRFALEASAYNLLDEDFELTPGVPGWGRSFKAMLKVRF